MQNTRSPKLFKHTALLSLAIFAMASSLLAQTATHDIILIENSSTDLSVTLDGSPVTVLPQQAPDQWTVTFPDTFDFGGILLFWEENPISDVLGNAVDGSGANQLSVFSDAPTGHSPAGEPNGSTQSHLVFDSGNLVTVNFKFTDLGDGSSSVPDTGSTLGLFIVSLIALLAARRSSVSTA
jgi:hypothetical protein